MLHTAHCTLLSCGSGGTPANRDNGIEVSACSCHLRVFEFLDPPPVHPPTVCKRKSERESDRTSVLVVTVPHSEPPAYPPAPFARPAGTAALATLDPVTFGIMINNVNMEYGKQTNKRRRMLTVQAFSCNSVGFSTPSPRWVR